MSEVIRDEGGVVSPENRAAVKRERQRLAERVVERIQDLEAKFAVLRDRQLALEARVTALEEQP